MTSIDLTAPVGQLVADRPARARVFERFDIDYCCGGKTPLDEACANKGLDLQEVLRALEQAESAVAAPDETDWRHASRADLIINIIDTHHVYLKRALPELAQLAAKTRQVHGASHPELAEVQEVFTELRAELEGHMMKEERILFPLIQGMESGAACEGFCGSVQNPIRVMEYEHDSAASALQRLRHLTGDYTPPADACNTYRALLSGLAELEADLHQHIHKENNILFPRAIELEATLLHTAPVDRHE
ncbi:MAG: iron-sulfur cluster repair di-iron protein [Phycisphaerae bacterium]|nr:iron-sulfur cluster repair di-iron protein [Phycisphaerae bacterium]